MSIMKTTPRLITKRNILVTSEMNKGRSHLYYEVNEILKKNPVPAEIRNSGITISGVTEQIINALKELKINFVSK